jgi:hypothetical protein
MKFSTEIEKSILKYNRHQIFEAILSKKSNAGGNTMPDLKLCYTVIITKTVWFWHKTRYINQWN